MQCPCCGVAAEIPNVARAYTDAYDQPATVTMPCCGKPVRVTPLRSYRVEPYYGISTEDDWGTPFTPNAWPELAA